MKWPRPVLRYYTFICSEELNKTTKNQGQPPLFPRYKAEVTPIEPTWSVCMSKKMGSSIEVELAADFCELGHEISNPVKQRIFLFEEKKNIGFCRQTHTSQLI